MLVGFTGESGGRESAECGREIGRGIWDWEFGGITGGELTKGVYKVGK